MPGEQLVALCVRCCRISHYCTQLQATARTQQYMVLWGKEKKEEKKRGINADPGISTSREIGFVGFDSALALTYYIALGTIVASSSPQPSSHCVHGRFTSCAEPDFPDS